MTRHTLIHGSLGLALSATMLVFSGCGTESEATCANDSECKGDRICQAGECVSPDVSGGGNTGGGNTGGGNTGGGNTGGGNTGGGNTGGGMSTMPGEFGADCTEDSQCNSGPCIFRSGVSNGFCSKNCDAVSECPMNYDCTVIGNASRKSCVPEDRLDDCNAHCQEFSFFMCLGDSAESACLQGCQDATVQERLTFSECGDPLMCTGESCFETLAPGKGPWFGNDSSSCNRDSTGACPSGDQEYWCKNGEKPEGFQPGMCDAKFYDPESQEELFCCFSF